MHSYYLSENHEMTTKEISKEDVREEIFQELEKAVLELNIAHENYNIASGELIDYYSYQIKAAQTKYDYLLKLTKEMNLSKFKKIV